MSPKLEMGQQWQLDHSRLEITTLGKTLVHFRVFKGQNKRPTHTTLLNRTSFDLYLKKNKAVLMKP